MNLRQSMKCPYCPLMAYLLRGKDAEVKNKGWTRYGCENEHKFAVPTHTVEQR